MHPAPLPPLGFAYVEFPHIDALKQYLQSESQLPPPPPKVNLVGSSTHIKPEKEVTPGGKNEGAVTVLHLPLPPLWHVVVVLHAPQKSLHVIPPPPNPPTNLGLQVF